MTNLTKHKQNKTKQEYGFVFVLFNCKERPKQIMSEDVSCQQILFLSADFVNRFLLSADFVFVSRFRQKIFFVSRFVFRQQMSSHLSTKRRSRRHIHFHASLFREGNIFSSGGRAFSLQSRLHSFCRTFLKKRPDFWL
jgi:hypothetical protein